MTGLGRMTVRQEVAGFQALFEQGVEHVFGGEVEGKMPGRGGRTVTGLTGNFAIIGLTQLLEAGAELRRGVGDVLHHVGREPDLADALLFIPAQGLEAFFHRADAVVHAGEDVAVPVRPAPEEAGGKEGLFLGERPHRFFASLRMTTICSE